MLKTPFFDVTVSLVSQQRLRIKLCIPLRPSPYYDNLAVTEPPGNELAILEETEREDSSSPEAIQHYSLDQ